MTNAVRELASYKIPSAHPGGREREFRVLAINGLHTAAEKFIAANGGTEFIRRIVHGSQPDRKITPFVSPHYKIEATDIPVGVIKPGSKNTPRHVDTQRVHVSFASSMNEVSDRRDDMTENMRDLYRIWERMKEEGQRRGVRQLRTSVPLFAVVEKNPLGAITWQFLVSVQSKLPTLAERLKELKKAGKKEHAEALQKNFEDFIKMMQDEYGIKPGTTATADYFVHHSEGEGKKPEFILILPRGGRVLSEYGAQRKRQK